MVKDATTGAPIYNAEVVLDGSIDYTDSYGIFDLWGVDPGCHSMIISHGDYEPEIFEVEVGAGDELIRATCDPGC